MKRPTPSPKKPNNSAPNLKFQKGKIKPMFVQGQGVYPLPVKPPNLGNPD